MTRMPEVVEMDVVAGLGTEGARRATGGRASGMAARLEVKILTQSPDRGNLTPKRQGRRPGVPGRQGGVRAVVPWPTPARGRLRKARRRKASASGEGRSQRSYRGREESGPGRTTRTPQSDEPVGGGGVASLALARRRSAPEPAWRAESSPTDPKGSHRGAPGPDGQASRTGISGVASRGQPGDPGPVGPAAARGSRTAGCRADRPRAGGVVPDRPRARSVHIEAAVLAVAGRKVISPRLRGRGGGDLAGVGARGMRGKTAGAPGSGRTRRPTERTAGARRQRSAGGWAARSRSVS